MGGSSNSGTRKDSNEQKKEDEKMNDLLNVNEKTYRIIKRSYLKAVKWGKDTLDILDEQGKPAILTAYAKYMIEYIEGQRKAKGLPIYDPSINDHVCKNAKCGYQWVGKKDPKCCPRCKSRQDDSVFGNCLTCGKPFLNASYTCNTCKKI